MNRRLGRDVKPGEGSEIRRANDSKVQRFFFLFTISRITTVLAGRHSILSKKRKESRRWISTFCQNPGFCSYSGREEKNLLFGNGWKRIFHRWEERNKEIQLQNRPFRRRFRPIVCVSTYYRVYIRIYIYMENWTTRTINRYKYLDGGRFSSIHFEFGISFLFEHAFASQLRRG